MFAIKIQKKYTQNSTQNNLEKVAGDLRSDAPTTHYGVTVTSRAAEWLLPEVAVTVMCENPGGVPVDGPC